MVITKEGSMLGEKIIALKKSLTEFASLIENILEKSSKGLLQKEKELLSTVINDDEPKTNDLEIEIEEQCISLLARYQPEAKDLRTILMILKMNNDLERMGDLAVNICESALFLIERPKVKPLIDLPRMAQETRQMVRDAITAFIDEDAKLAQSVCEWDNIIDNLREQTLRELITYMTSDATTIQRSLHLMRVSHNFERIADLATNICEDVIYIVEGQVIKHHRDDLDY
jgi:phosphate transport system protein